MGTAGWLWHARGPVSIGGGSRVSQTYSGDRGLRPRGVLLVGLSVAVGVLVSKFLVRLIGRPVARRVSRQSVAQTIVRGVRVGTITLSLLVGLWAIGFRFTDLLVGTAVFRRDRDHPRAARRELHQRRVHPRGPAVRNRRHDRVRERDNRVRRGHQIRYTKIFTLDNTFLVVPNGTMRERDVTNYSAEDERTRRTIEVLVTYESDVSEARRLIERAARDCDAVIDGGPDIRVGGVARYVASPDCRLHEFGDDGVLLRLRYWVKKPYKLAKVQSDVNTRIRERVTDADVEMAYPHRHLVFDDTSGIARVGGPESGRPAGERAGDKQARSEGRGGNGSPDGAAEATLTDSEPSTGADAAAQTDLSGGDESGDNR